METSCDRQQQNPAETIDRSGSLSTASNSSKSEMRSMRSIGSRSAMSMPRGQVIGFFRVGALVKSKPLTVV
jgi:hypothetical protein